MRSPKISNELEVKFKSSWLMSSLCVIFFFFLQTNNASTEVDGHGHDIVYRDVGGSQSTEITHQLANLSLLSFTNGLDEIQTIVLERDAVVDTNYGEEQENSIHVYKADDHGNGMNKAIVEIVSYQEMESIDQLANLSLSDVCIIGLDKIKLIVLDKEKKLMLLINMLGLMMKMIHMIR